MGLSFSCYKKHSDSIIGQYRRTAGKHDFGTVGLSYNRFRTETASTKAFKQLVIRFFQALQNMIDNK